MLNPPKAITPLKLDYTPPKKVAHYSDVYTPDTWLRAFYRDPLNRVWIKDIRDKYDILPPKEIVPQGLTEDIRQYLDSKLGPDSKLFDVDADFQGLFTDYHERVFAGMAEAVRAYILSGRVVPIPPEFLYQIKHFNYQIAKDLVVTVQFGLGGPLTDHRRFAREWVEQADRIYGRPPPGRRRDGKFAEWVEAFVLEEVRTPQQMALEYIDRNPDVYPFGVLTDQAEVTALAGVFKKELKRLKARDPDRFDR